MATDTKTVERIKALRASANAVGDFHELYATKYAPDTHCDKKGYGFGMDGRFAAFTVKASFDSWAGYYGNSSCSTILSVYHREMVEKTFVKAMNLHQKELFATAARLMREEAASLTEAATKEIEALRAMLESAVADVAEAQSEAA